MLKRSLKLTVIIQLTRRSLGAVRKLLVGTDTVDEIKSYLNFDIQLLYSLFNLLYFLQWNYYSNVYISLLNYLAFQAFDFDRPE